mgnify:CR=1 FL=1
MKKILAIILLFVSVKASSQETVYPAKAQTETITITNATIHVGNGTVITNGFVTFENGNIKAVGQSNPPAGGKVIYAKVKHV